MTTLLTILIIVSVFLLLLKLAKRKKDYSGFISQPNESKVIEDLKQRNPDISKNQIKRAIKFRYKKGNCFGNKNMPNMPPDIYGQQLMNRRNYSHKQTNK